jgi:hypothetical protein
MQELFICIATEFLNLCPEGANATVCWGFVVENGDTSLETTSYVRRNEP